MRQGSSDYIWTWLLGMLIVGIIFLAVCLIPDNNPLAWPLSPVEYREMMADCPGEFEVINNIDGDVSDIICIDGE